MRQWGLWWNAALIVVEQLVKTTWSWLQLRHRLQRMPVLGVQVGHLTLRHLVEFRGWALTFFQTRMVWLPDQLDPKFIIKLHFYVQKLSNIWQPCLSTQVSVEHCSEKPQPSRLWMCRLEVWLPIGDGPPSHQRSAVVSSWLDCLVGIQMARACGYKLAQIQSKWHSTNFGLPEVSSSGIPTTLTSSNSGVHQTICSPASFKMSLFRNLNLRKMEANYKELIIPSFFKTLPLRRFLFQPQPKCLRLNLELFQFQSHLKCLRFVTYLNFKKKQFKLMAMSKNLHPKFSSTSAHLHTSTFINNNFSNTLSEWQLNNYDNQQYEPRFANLILNYNRKNNRYNWNHLHLHYSNLLLYHNYLYQMTISSTRVLQVRSKVRKRTGSLSMHLVLQHRRDLHCMTLQILRHHLWHRCLKLLMLRVCHHLLWSRPLASQCPWLLQMQGWHQPKGQLHQLRCHLREGPLQPLWWRRPSWWKVMQAMMVLFNMEFNIQIFN